MDATPNDLHFRLRGLRFWKRRSPGKVDILDDSLDRDEIYLELNTAWDAFEKGDYESATLHSRNVINKSEPGTDAAVKGQLILLKMKTRKGLFAGLLDELEELFQGNLRISAGTQAAIANEIIRICQRSENLALGAQRGEVMIRDFSHQWPDVEVVELLCQVAACHFLRGDVNRSEELITRAIHLAQESNSPKSLAQSYWQMSSVSAGRGNMPISLSQNEEARHWAKLAEMNRILPILNSNAAAILLELPAQDLPHIHQLAESAYLELTALNDPASASYACVTLAEVELRQFNFQGAHAYVDRGLAELPPEIPGPRASLYIQKAKILARTGNYMNSEAQAENAIKILQTMDASQPVATSWGHLARVFVEIGQVDRGAYAYEQALQIAGVVREEPEMEIRRINQKQY